MTYLSTDLVVSQGEQPETAVNFHHPVMGRTAFAVVRVGDRLTVTAYDPIVFRAIADAMNEAAVKLDVAADRAVGQEINAATVRERAEPFGSLPPRQHVAAAVLIEGQDVA